MLTTVRHIFGRIMHSETALHSQWDKGQKNNLLFASPSIRRPTFQLSNRSHFYCLFINVTIKLCNGFPIRITVFSHLFLFRIFFSDFCILRYLLIFLCLFAASGHYKKKDTCSNK